jgi:hypothetical protein
VHVYAISVMLPWLDSIAYNAVMCSLPSIYGNEGMQPNICTPGELDSTKCHFLQVNVRRLILKRTDFWNQLDLALGAMDYVKLEFLDPGYIYPSLMRPLISA